MTIQLDKTRTYTVEEFMSLPDDGKRYELIEGVLKEMPGPNTRHGIVTSRLFRFLGNFLEAQGQSSDQVLNNMAFELAKKPLQFLM